MIGKSLFFADIDVTVRNWHKEVEHLVRAAPDWYEISRRDAYELQVNIRTNSRVISIKERAARLLLSVDFEHGPFGALFILAVGKRLEATVFDDMEQPVSVDRYDPSASWLNGVEHQISAAAAEALGLKHPGPKYREGKLPPRLCV